LTVCCCATSYWPKGGIRFSPLATHISDAKALRWIPTVYHASLEERPKYALNRSRTMIIWDPAKCAINDEIRITDYFGPAT
jgi:hypothetical protein